MRRVAIAMGVWVGLASAALAESASKDYVGPFPTEKLYAMCSDNHQRDKCLMYLQGLMYGLRIQKNLSDQGSAICLPEMSPEEARARILKLIETTTAGKPQDNKDGGDWIAVMGIAAGNLCKQRGKT
jgi:hypothetical protein